MDFPVFLPLLVAAFHARGIRPFVLRNYEGFPFRNGGADIDFLVYRHQIAAAVDEIAAIPEIRMVGTARRYYAFHTFWQGASTVPGLRSIQLDFMWNLTWKGFPFLPTELLLESAIERRAGQLLFFTPNPAHEAIISLLSTLLPAGSIKEKYFSAVQQTFGSIESEVTSALTCQFGRSLAQRLTHAVIEGNRQRVLECVKPMRASLTLRGLRHAPLRSASRVAGYYWREFAVRRLPGTLETVCVSGPSPMNARIADGLLPLLQFSAKEVEHHEFVRERPLGSEGPVAQIKAVPSVPGIPGSVFEVLQLLFKAWLSRFDLKPNLTIRLYSSRCAELLAGQESYRYRCPAWFLSFLRRLFPSADVCIVIGPRGADESTLRTRIVRLDASLPFEVLLEQAYAAATDRLATRAARQLRQHREALGCSADLKPRKLAL